MTLYPFEISIAVDSTNPDTVIRDADVTIYDPLDTSFASPLALVDTSGASRANPIRTTPQGYVTAFQATLPLVLWKSGPYTGYLASYKGLLAEAQAARAAAELAATRGQPAGGTTGQVLRKHGTGDYDSEWFTQIVVIGPTDAWPTGLPNGTVVVRSSV
jgi:hypothetical protein